MKIRTDFHQNEISTVKNLKSNKPIKFYRFKKKKINLSLIIK